VIGHLECRKFGKSKNGKIWRYGSPKIRKFKNLVNRTFGNSQNRRFGKTEIRQIAKSERKGILKNKRITGMSVKLLFHPHLRVSRPSGHFYCIEIKVVPLRFRKNTHLKKVGLITNNSGIFPSWFV